MKSRMIILGVLGLALLTAIAGASHMIQVSGSTDARAGNGGISRPLGLSEPAGVAEPGAGAALSTPTTNGIVVGRDYKHDVSPPLRDIPPRPIGPGNRTNEANDNRSIPLYGHKDLPDPIVQRFMGPLAMPTPILSFEGIDINGGCGGCLPPDTNGEVGPNNYVQTVNSAVQVWDKTGTSLMGPVAINTLWTGFGGSCETRNDGDPVVMYDQLADRWLISQFTDATPFSECIAISTTPDPTGAYHRYAFALSPVNFEDYPKFGVWPDGYYMSANQFDNHTTWAGPRPYVFDRAKMLLGQAATFQTTANALGDTVAPILPADLDGSTLPPAGAPNYFLGFGSPMPFYEFHVDWAVPANTTFTNPTNVTNTGFTELCPSNKSCVPQPGTTVGLDGLADRGMFRLAYRNFGTHQSLVGNFSVDVGAGQAGVRWYEIRNPGAGATLFQEGTYAPDATSRWMGSVAMDRDGNLAVGYSASSGTLFPSLRYAGRLANDPVGQLTRGETTLFTGLGSQTNDASRWGDYSNLTLDPIDDCTFWYTNEYNPATGDANWQTRIGSFRFPGCGGPQVTPTRGTTTPTSTPGTTTPTSTPGTPTTVTPTVTAGASPTACAIQFTDVLPGSTFYDYVRCMACRGIVNGYADGTFKPNANVTRGQLSKIVSNAAGFNDTQTTQMFEDVPPGSTFFDYIGRLASRGYIGGYACGGDTEPCLPPDNLPYFRPNNNATRGQISKINSNAAGFNDDPADQQFEDVDPSSPYYTYTSRLVSRSIMSGYACGGDAEPCLPPDNLPYFRPNNNATRGQTSKIVANTFFPNCQTP